MLGQKNIPIPQNVSDFFIIEEGDWDCTIDIKFNPKKELNLLFLFCILKSYVIKNEHLIYYVMSISQKTLNDKNVQTYTKISLNNLQKVHFIDFVEFFERLIDKDYEYISINELYGFRIIFFSESHFWKKKLIFPIFPWKGYIEKLALSEGKYSSNSNYEIITKLKNKNKVLLKKNINLRKIIKNPFLKKNKKKKKVPS